MLWINAHKRHWRLAFLGILAVSIFGPWVFDNVMVPSPYPCSPPSVRLDDKLCGFPTSLSLFYGAILSGFDTMITDLVSGSTSFVKFLQQAAVLFALLILLLPFLTTGVLIIWGDRPFWRIIHRLVLSLAVAVGVWIIWSIHFKTWVLWGCWLYTCSATFALLLDTWPVKKNQVGGQL